VGGQLTISRKFLKISNVSLTYNLQRSGLSNINTTELPANLINNVSSLIFAGTYDTRNDLFNPTRGIYSQLSNEFAGYYFSGSVAFYRLIGELKYFHSWTPNTILAVGILVGRIDPAKGFTSLPLNERFYTGGPNSLRGYDYQKVGPLDTGNSPIGGELKLVWHIFEVRQTIYKMFGAAIFADAGNVWKLPRSFKLGGIRYDGGAGLRVNTPIGLVRLDYAFKINRRPGESIGKLYFGMGQAF